MTYNLHTDGRGHSSVGMQWREHVVRSLQTKCTSVLYNFILILNYHKSYFILFFYYSIIRNQIQGNKLHYFTYFYCCYIITVILEQSCSVNEEQSFTSSNQAPDPKCFDSVQDLFSLSFIKVPSRTIKQRNRVPLEL